ncbi:unnamed protein product [Mytilus edulis]|uniref:WSC domain-containing protein n=1 Tax=Mytilus edulis TaxID=6550 RepID=A0A8S3T4D9_MYTED|nr:unnamed protein product [Mytilus edulis]
MQLFILTICITFSDCSIFIGFPISNWTTSSEVCSLPKVHSINTTDIFINLSENTTLKEDDKAWTGTVIKYTKFAAFIGCGRSYSPIDSGKNVETMEDCLRHCSDYSLASYFVLKSSNCFCISDKPELDDDVNDCRTECINASYTPCSSGRSALVFSFVEDINITTTNTYIEQECVTTNKGQNRFTISDCNAQYLYGCKNTSGKLSGTEFCVAVKKGKTNEFTVEECSRKYPFLCSRIRMYEEQLKQVNERLPGTEFSNYTRIEDSNEEVNNPGYNELSDESSQHNESEFEASKDKVDSHGYLMPEQHYHTIPEVEVHYAEANVAESSGNKEHIGNDGYLVPVSK